MRLTKRGEKVVAIASVFGFIAILGIAGAIETQPNPATDAQCDSIYHAVMILEDNPARESLIHTAWDLDCPFDNEGEHLYTWTPESR